MRNLKFGALFLGLAMALTALVGVSAQTVRVQGDPVGRARLMTLDGRGAQLGVMVSDLDPKAANSAGVRIDDVNDHSPAERAGIKAGDVVVEYDGERVRSARQFTRLVQETPEGRSVKIALLRDGKRQVVDATPDSGAMTWSTIDPDRLRDDIERGLRGFSFDAPEFRAAEPRRFEYRLPERVTPFMAAPRARLGVTVQPLTRDLEEYFGSTNGGALVSSVTPESAAAKAGIKAGDVIVAINGRGVRDADQLRREMDTASGDVNIVVIRDRKEQTLKATIEPRRPATARPGSRPGLVL